LARSADAEGAPVTVDVDDAATWPAPVREWASGWADRRGLSLESLPVDLMEREPELRALLSGQKLIAFHCTRLLEHEVAEIRERGLRQLTADLIADRIASAHAAGAINEELRNLLSSKNALEWWNADSREGQVCTVLGRGTLDEHARGVSPFLETWGGEGIYFAWDRTDTEEELKRLGRPAIVVVRLDVTDGERAWCYSLGRPFVERLVGVEPGAELFYKDDVPAEDLLAIWQPGDPEYDRHRDLPIE
jgi:hypothetical protein